MGDSYLSVEVLSEPELFHWVVGADERAGAIESRGKNTYEFRFRGDAQAASELLATLVQQGVRVSRDSPGAGIISKTCSSRWDRRSCRDDWDRIRAWLDNPILIKHVRSRLRPAGRPQLAGRRGAALPLHRLCGICSSTSSRPAAPPA